MIIKGFNELVNLKEEIRSLLTTAQKEKIFPGAAAGISGKIGGHREQLTVSCGNACLIPEQVSMREDLYFDLASLTKPLATTLAVLCLIKEKKISLEESLPDLLQVPIEKKKKRYY